MKEERRSERRGRAGTGKGPEIDWADAVNTSNTKIDDVIAAGPGGGDGSAPLATSDSSAYPTAPPPPPRPVPAPANGGAPMTGAPMTGGA
ncbi:MAG: hypothetical protein M3680_16930, partial [Myxococcota bacterium]|nr:hypothetical protein [Myxococcota bacterium]